MTGAAGQLYLTTPPELDTPHALDQVAAGLETALDHDRISAVLLRGHEADDRSLRRAAARLAPLVQARGVAFLVEDRLEIAATAGADGVHLQSPGAAVSAARQAIGPEAIVGVACSRSRHEAMVAGEAGADYVAVTFEPGLLDETLALLDWWREIMVLPLVIDGDMTPDQAGCLARAGADFLAPGQTVWDHPKGPAAGVAALLEGIVSAAG